MDELAGERGQAAWFMLIIDIRLGHGLGFEYPMSGDFLTRWRAR